MHKIKLIKYLEISENIMCVYRNYLFFGKKKIYFILAHVLIELIMYLLLFINNINLLRNANGLPVDVMYFYLFLCSSIYSGDMVCSLYGLYKGDVYKNFLANLLTLHNICKNYKDYNSNLKKLEIILLTIFTVTLILAVGSTAINTISYFTNTSHINLAKVLLSNFSIMRSQILFTLENLVLCAFISLLSNILSSLNATLMEIREQKQELNTMSLGISRQTHSLNVVDKIQKSAELYNCTVDLSNKLSMCFKHQVNIHVNNIYFGSFLDNKCYSEIYCPLLILILKILIFTIKLIYV